MVFDLIEKLFPYVFGVGGLLGWFWQYRKNNVDITIQVQSIYKTLIADTRQEIEEIKKEVQYWKDEAIKWKQKYQSTL